MSQLAQYAVFAKYNQWMTAKIYETCANLSDVDRKLDRGAFFKSVHGTLNHILLGDRAWMWRLADRKYHLAQVDEDLYDDFDELREAHFEMASEISGWVDGITDAWLAEDLTWSTSLDGIERSQPRWLLLSHMFNHQTHHRGQLSTLLTQAGHDIGVTDLPRMT